jgi:beta-lactamase class A
MVANAADDPAPPAQEIASRWKNEDQMPGRRRHHRVARRLIPARIAVIAGLAAGILLVVLVMDTRAHDHARLSAASITDRDALPAVRARRSAPHDSRPVAARADPLYTPAVRSLIDGRQGNVSAAVADLATGQEWYWNPNGRYQTASIIKVDILETLLHQAMLSHTPLDTNNSGLAQTMIENSSDTAASSLWDELGGSSGVGDYNGLVGLSQTTLNTDGYWGESLTSAADQVRLLDELVRPNSLLDHGSQTYELGLMENVESDQTWGISAGVPAGVTVAIKNGWVPITSDSNWEINSIGWVDGDGRDYLIAVLTSGDPSEAYGITTIEDIAPHVWDGLAPTR